MLRWPFRFLCFLGLLLILVTFSPLTYWWGRASGTPWAQPRGDVLIVLGSSIVDDDILGQSTYWRTAYALREIRKGGIQKVVVAGTQVSEDMKRFLVANGVPADLIVAENQSRSTRENALNTREILSLLPGRK